MRSAVEWADKIRRSWAFSDGNAGARYTRFYRDLSKLDAIDWGAVAAVDWQNPLIKEGKQAEFLMLDSFPWRLVETIGVIDQRTLTDVSRRIQGAEHKPFVSVQRNWYY